MRRSGSRPVSTAIAIDRGAVAASCPSAIERGEIDVLFQPQVEIATDAIVGVEALARWNIRGWARSARSRCSRRRRTADCAGELSEYLQAARWRRRRRGPRTRALRLSVNVAAADIASRIS